MANNFRHIHQYYSPDDLFNRIITGFNKLGKDVADITLDDLLPVDEFHIRGNSATKELIKLAEFTPDMHILDMGCGIGGSARRLSQETGCRVTGIDLSEAYIDTAERLTRLFDLQEHVVFRVCSALELPFEEGFFDGVWSLHMNMNIEDKLSWLKETFRVIKSGGRAVFYEVCGNQHPPLHFPVPWAQDSSMSFLVPPELLFKQITSTGFEIRSWVDKTDLAQKTFAKMKRPEGEPDLPNIGLHLLMGDDSRMKTYNLHRNLIEKRISLIETVAVKKNL